MAGTMTTEGMEVLRAAREVLNTTPPEDPIAGFVGGLIGVIDLMREPAGPVPVCSVCGRPARYESKWVKLPRPDVFSQWVCARHRQHAEERDRLNDYGDHYVKMARKARKTAENREAAAVQA